MTIQELQAPKDPVGVVAFLAEYAIVIALPLLVVLIWTTVDIWRRPGVDHRVAWTLGCWLFWPAILAYFALRPLADGGNRRFTGSQDDSRAALVRAVLSTEPTKSIQSLRPID